MDGQFNKLCAGRLGFALGLIWGVAMFLLALSTLWLGYGAEWVKLMASVYIGFAPTPFGAVIGFFFGFVDFFVFGFLIALIYNCCCPKQCCPHKSKDSK